MEVLELNDEKAQPVVTAQRDGLALFCLRPPLIAWLIWSVSQVMPRLSHTPAFEQSRAPTIEAASQLIDGKVGIIATARRLSSLRFALIGDELDDAWRVFVGIDSETDHLPVGEERKNWSADALLAKDAEIKSTEAHYRSVALAAAHALLHRYEKKG